MTGIFAAPNRPVSGPNVLVVSDVFAKVPASARPAPGKPVYYLILGGHHRDIGGMIAHEPMPSSAAVRKGLVAAMASEGFRLTGPGGPIPSIIVVYSWGSVGANDVATTGVDPSTGDTVTTDTVLNTREIAQLVGLDKARSQMLLSYEADELNEAANEDRLYLFVAAFDARSLLQHKQKLVWRTRMSIDALQGNLPDCVDVMLTSAAPYFGRETSIPTFIGNADRRKAKVTVGQPQVIKSDVALPPKSSNHRH